jgi:hypothetical protein
MAISTINQSGLNAPLTLTSPVLGTPTSGTLTNCTGLPTSGIAASAWTSYTPTITAAAGSITSYTASGAYQIIGKTCIANVNISITNAGSGSGSTNIILPVTPAARIQIGGYGMEVNVNGGMLKGYIPASSTSMQTTYYNNGGTVQTNATLIVTVIYETA